MLWKGPVTSRPHSSCNNSCPAPLTTTRNLSWIEDIRARVLIVHSTQTANKQHYEVSMTFILSCPILCEYWIFLSSVSDWPWNPGTGKHSNIRKHSYQMGWMFWTLVGWGSPNKYACLTSLPELSKITHHRSIQFLDTEVGHHDALGSEQGRSLFLDQNEYVPASDSNEWITTADVNSAKLSALTVFCPPKWLLRTISNS